MALPSTAHHLHELLGCKGVGEVDDPARAILSTLALAVAFIKVGVPAHVFLRRQGVEEFSHRAVQRQSKAVQASFQRCQAFPRSSSGKSSFPLTSL